MADVNATVESTAEPMVAAIRRLVMREMADPSGTRPMVAEVAVGDLGNDPAAKAELAAACSALVDSNAVAQPSL
jgi:hypothetical protein